MADRKISQFSELAANQTHGDDALPIVSRAGGSTAAANRLISLRTIQTLLGGTEASVENAIRAEDAAIAASGDADRAEDAAAAASGGADRAENAVINAQASSRTVATWAALTALTGATVGEGAEVLDTDTGTHTDPVVGGSVANGGRYSWSASPAGWRRVGATGLAGKASLTIAAVPRAPVIAGADIGLIHKPGYYLLPASAAYLNAPPGWDTTAVHDLTVEVQGSADGVAGLFVRQRIETRALSTSGPRAGQRRRFVRVVNTTNPNNQGQQYAWVEETSRLATEIYAQCGNLATGTDLDTVLTPGTYLMLANGGYIAAPADMDVTRSYLLRVYPPGSPPQGLGIGRFAHQEISAVIYNPGAYRGWMRGLDGLYPGTQAGKWTATASGGAGPLLGKSVVCCGDSVTEGSWDYKYPPVLASRTGATVINGGFGGCRMAAHTGFAISPLYDPMSMYRISERIKNGDWSVLTAAAQALFDAEGDDNRPQAAALAAVNWSNVDFLTIAYGTNDFGAAVPIGTDSDNTGATFKGAINYTLANILSTYPNIRPVFVTPLWRSRVVTPGDDSNVTPNASDLYLRDYVDAIKSRAAAWQVPVIDLHATSGINIANWATMMPDGLHPWSSAGNTRVANVIAGGLEAIS